MDMSLIRSRENWLSDIDDRFGEASAEGMLPPSIPENASAVSKAEYAKALSETDNPWAREWREFVEFVLVVARHYRDIQTSAGDREFIRGIFAKNGMLNCLLVSVLDEQKWLVRSAQDVRLAADLLALVAIHDGAEGQYVDEQTLELFHAIVEAGIDLREIVQVTSATASPQTSHDLIELLEDFVAG
jgi:hypothetical protein